MRHALTLRGSRQASWGFSLVELVVSLAILMILSAIAVPTLMRSYRAYILGDAASRFSGIVKLARFEAIRRNTRISLRVQRTGADCNVSDCIAWSDTNNNSIVDPAEAQMLLPHMVNILPAGSVPDPAPIINAIGPAISTFTVQSANSVVTYGGRGGIDFGGGAPTVFVYYLGNTAIPDFGARAVVLLPSGAVQLWSSSSGRWQRVS